MAIQIRDLKMRDKGIDKGLVREFDDARRATRGHGQGFFGFRKMFRDYLTKLNVPFYDACCPDLTEGQGLPARILTAAQNNIAAGTGGAISVTNYTTTVNTDATDDAFTLADGTLIGQLKKIVLVVDGGGNAVITPANLAGGTTITLDDATDQVELIWNGTEWVVVANLGGVVA